MTADGRRMTDVSRASWFRVETALVLLAVRTEDGCVREIRFHESVDRPPDGRVEESVAAELTDYATGRRKVFSVPVRPEGTDFERRVWTALRGIPYGETRSYGSIANSIGDPRGARAVGLANGRNPIPIIIPCHRVIGSDGTLTGFGGGLDLKRRLLELEGAIAPSLW